jgi:hypothetical protein
MIKLLLKTIVINYKHYNKALLLELVVLLVEVLVLPANLLVVEVVEKHPAENYPAEKRKHPVVKPKHPVEKLQVEKTHARYQADLGPSQ